MVVVVAGVIWLGYNKIQEIKVRNCVANTDNLIASWTENYYW